jgi:hypothetical protein
MMSARVYQIQGATRTFAVDQNAHIAVEPRHFAHPFDSAFRLDQCAEDTGNADDGNGKCVVVVVVEGPEHNRGDLEDVEWVEDL